MVVVVVGGVKVVLCLQDLMRDVMGRDINWQQKQKKKEKKKEMEREVESAHGQRRKIEFLRENK